MVDTGLTATGGALLQTAFAGNTSLPQPDTAGSVGVAGLLPGFLAALAKALHLTEESSQALEACPCDVRGAVTDKEALAAATLFSPSGQDLAVRLPTATGASSERKDQVTPGSGAVAPGAELDPPPAGSPVHPAPVLLSGAALYVLLQAAALWPPVPGDAPEPLDGQLPVAGAATDAPTGGPRLLPSHTALRPVRVALEAGRTATGMPIQTGLAGTPTAEESSPPGIPVPAEHTAGHVHGFAEGAPHPEREERLAARPTPLLPGQDALAQFPRPEQVQEGPASDTPEREQHTAHSEISAPAPEAQSPRGSRHLAAPPAAHGWAISPWVPGAPAQPARPAGRASVERPPAQHLSQPQDASMQPDAQLSTPATQPPDALAGLFEPDRPAPEAPQPSVTSPAALPSVRQSRSAQPSDEPASRQEAPAQLGEEAPVPSLAATVRPAIVQAPDEHLSARRGTVDGAVRRPEHADPGRSQTQRDENDPQAALLTLAPAQPQGESGSRAVPLQSLVMQVLSRAHQLTSPTGRVVRFRLEPEQLGELEVRLMLRAHGGLDLRIAAPADDVGHALAAAWPELRDALAARGLHPERLLVTVQSSDLALSTSGGSPHSSPGHERPFESPSASYRLNGGQSAPPEADPATRHSLEWLPRGRLDYRV